MEIVEKYKTKRIVTKIGDIFCVEFPDNTKGYFQYIAKDMTQLNSSVIRAFYTRYPINDNVKIEDIINDEVDFYAHTILRAGIDYETWYKIGNSKKLGENGLDNVIFGQTNSFEYEQEPSGRWIMTEVDPLTNWFVWHVNEEFTHVGKISVNHIPNLEVGSVMPYSLIKARMQSGYYPTQLDIYSLFKRIPKPEYKSYIKDTSDGKDIYICFQGDYFEKAVIPIDGKLTKISRDEAVLNGLDIVRKKFSDTNWKAQNFITEDEFNKAWNSAK